MALAAWGIACYTTAGASQDEIDALHTNGAKVLPKETASRLHMHKIGKAHLGEQVTAFGEDIIEYEEEPPLSLGQQGHRAVLGQLAAAHREELRRLGPELRAA